jgi:hypothetical protein
MLTIKVLFKSGKQEVYSFHDFTPHINSFNQKLELGVIQDYEILG